MKKTILFLLLAAAFSAKAQDRVSVPLPKVQVTSTRTLVNAKGWALKETTGQWISAQNRIPFPKETAEEIDNFVSYDFREVRINDTVYTLMLKKYKSGWWDYPHIYSGWHSTVNGEWYVFYKKDIDSLSVISDSINFIKLYPIHHGWIENSYYKRQWNNSTYISDIQKEIAGAIHNNKKETDHLVLHIFPNRTKNIVRFNFYSSGSNRYDYPRFISSDYQPKDPNGKYGYEKMVIYGTSNLFKYCYYETDLASFQNFIPIK